MIDNIFSQYSEIDSACSRRSLEPSPSAPPKVDHHGSAIEGIDTHPYCTHSLKRMIDNILSQYSRNHSTCSRQFLEPHLLYHHKLTTRALPEDSTNRTSHIQVPKRIASDTFSQHTWAHSTCSRLFLEPHLRHHQKLTTRALPEHLTKHTFYTPIFKRITTNTFS